MFRTDLIGNLGQDPETRYTQAGAQIVNLRIAVNLRQREGDEWKDVTEWVGARIMGRQAEYASKLTKGTRVYVTGTLDVRRFDTRKGEPGFALDVWADEVVALSDRRPDNGPAPRSTAPVIQRQTRPDAGVADDDLPF